MTPTDAGAYAARLERVRTASLDARQAKLDPPEAAAIDEDTFDTLPIDGVPLDGIAPDTLPLDAASVEGPGEALASSPDEPLDLPPPPVVLVRRLGETASPPPTRLNGRRLALGIDPLDEIRIPRGLKSSIERVVGGLAERRDDD